jgi:hypothetical protein
MTGLTGLRLAIYDELLRDGALDTATLARALADTAGTAEALGRITAAVGWLQERRLLVPRAGTWSAVILGLARMNYETNGPATAAAPTSAAPRATAPAPTERGATEAVQRHQREFFCNVASQTRAGEATSIETQS